MKFLQFFLMQLITRLALALKEKKSYNIIFLFCQYLVLPEISWNFTNRNWSQGSRQSEDKLKAKMSYKYFCVLFLCVGLSHSLFTTSKLSAFFSNHLDTNHDGVIDVFDYKVLACRNDRKLCNERSLKRIEKQVYKMPEQRYWGLLDCWSYCSYGPGWIRFNYFRRVFFCLWKETTNQQTNSNWSSKTLYPIILSPKHPDANFFNIYFTI